MKLIKHTLLQCNWILTITCFFSSFLFEHKMFLLKKNPVQLFYTNYKKMTLVVELAGETETTHWLEVELRSFYFSDELWRATIPGQESSRIAASATVLGWRVIIIIKWNHSCPPRPTYSSQEEEMTGCILILILKHAVRGWDWEWKILKLKVRGGGEFIQTV